MEDLKKKYKAERRNHRSVEYVSDKSQKSDLIDRLTKKYAEELEEDNPPPQKAPPPKVRSNVKHKKMMVLHNINEEDSELEQGSDAEGNRTFDLGRDRPLLKTQLGENDNASKHTGKSPHLPSYQSTAERGANHNRFNSLDLTKLDNRKLKQFIHHQTKVEKEKEEKAKVAETQGKHPLVKPLSLGSLLPEEVQQNYNTPRFEEDDEEEGSGDKAGFRLAKPDDTKENNPSEQLKAIDARIKHIKQDSMGFGNLNLLNESGLLEYSMEMQKQLKGLLNDGNESVLNESLNVSRVGGHRRQYSNDQSVLFGREYANETFNKEVDEDENDEKDVNTSNFLNLKGLFNDREAERPNFDFNEQEKEFKKMFEIDEIENTEDKDDNLFGFRNDVQTNSDNSREHSKPREGNDDSFNPFKSPITPEKVEKSEKSRHRNRKESKAKNGSEEKKSESGEIKIVHDQYSEWNKRITKALNDDNYYNDAATKLSKRAPTNPLDKLTLENMKDMDGSPSTSSHNKKYLRASPSNENLVHKELHVAGSNNLKVPTPEAKSLFVSFNNDAAFTQKEQVEDTSSIKDALRIEIILILINTDLVSDFEVSRSKKYLKDFLSSNPECLEAHYGLSQVYFSLGLYNKALEEISIALESNKSDSQYLTWKAIYLFYLFKTLSDRTKKVEALRRCEETCKKILVNERRNLFPLYLFLVLMVEVAKLKAEGVKISSNTTKKPEDYAKRIKDINEYLGELAYVELQLIDPEKVIEGRENLIKIVEKYPKYPHAFIRLFMHDFVDNHFSHALQTIEQVYLNYDDFHTIPELET